MLFVSSLHKEGLEPGTVKSYLAAMRFEQISRGMGDPGISRMPQLEYVLKGLKRRAHGWDKTQAPDHVRDIEKAEAGLGWRHKLTGCQDAVGCKLLVLLWVFTVGGDCYTIT